MTMFSKRPPSLVCLSDEVAARALSKCFGNVTEAARDLGVDRKDLRRLTWSNPAVLAAAYERMELFVITMQSELMSQSAHRSSRVRQCAFDRMYKLAAIPDHPVGKAFAGLPLGLLARAPRVRSVVKAERVEAERAEAERALAREAVAELDRERAAEFERELAFEMNGDRRPGQEDEETRADIELRALRSLDWRDADPVREAPATVSEEPTPELAPQSGLPVWPGPYAPLPLVAHLYAPWTLSKGVLAAPQLQREHGQELRRRLSRGGWR